MSLTSRTRSSKPRLSSGPLRLMVPVGFFGLTLNEWFYVAAIRLYRGADWRIGLQDD
ncbi:hypothetical protein [Enterobacter phage 01_vB_Eclo_IJM]|nr:hypothetical protein [Enterobacter phage 01_vB_Eclo_IJM]